MADWQFAAELIDVHDGDTITVECDLGFDARMLTRIRLLDVYAPELREQPDAATGNPGGAAALAFVRQWLNQSATGEWPLIVRTTKLPTSPETFGRYVAEVTNRAGESLNAAIRGFLGGKRFGTGAR
jgi:endonuclease YncB( thermonuclease family)